MKRIYTALNLPDAHIVANLLQNSDIAVKVFNVNAASAMGELPADAALPQVWIEDERDEARARALIKSYQSAGDSSIVKPCNHCGEENPFGFELCWNCGIAI